MIRIIAGLLASCIAVVSPAAEYRIDRPHPVVDPAYGQILYDYYQKRYFAAMTHILVSLETGALPTQSQRAQVLLGSLYATYGMPGEAEELFEQLLAESVDQELATRIWIHIANLYYQQQRYQKALDTLDTHVAEVPRDVRQNYFALRTRILMKLGRYEDTSAALDNLQDGAVLSGYLKYNLAVSRINIGDGRDGERLLWELVNLAPGSEEINSLKDKAMLALGVHYLRSGDPRAAQHVLGAARVEGPYSETALLLHARAWLATREPMKALGSLQELTQRSMQFEETQEAALSLPWLYEQLGDYARAQQGYRDAIRAYTDHYRYLTELEEKVRSGQWFQELAQEPIWSTAMDPLPPFEPRRVESFPTFQHMFAQHAFHTRWLDYHEQWRQIRLLEDWQGRLPALDELLAAHIRKHREQAPKADTLLARVDEEKLPQRLKAMEGVYARAVQQDEYEVFADGKELKLLNQLKKAEEKAGNWQGKIEPEQADRVEFWQRVLRWEIEQNIVPLQWQRRRELDALQAELGATSGYAQRVKAAASGDLGRITELGYQLAGMHNALTGLENRGHDILARQQDGIETLALDKIEFTRARLRAFTAECWVALGDLQNRVLRERYKPVPRSAAPVTDAAVSEEEEGGARSPE